MNTIGEIENRFKEVSGLTHLDLSVSHFCKGDNQQQKTTKQEYKNWGFVCTPLWLVDEMIEPQMETLGLTSKTCDACCGCGQFSIRLMRKMYNKFKAQGVSETKLDKWVDKVFLAKNHYFTEFQFSNVAKLIYIFGTKINVYIGDTLNLKYSSDNDSGLMFFNDKKKRWYNIPNLVEKIAPYKDNLDVLVQIFVGLEEKLMPMK